MIIDSSALIAILRKEREAARFTRAILRDSVRLISVANLLEAGIVIDNQGGLRAGQWMDAFVERAEIDIEPVTEAQGKDRPSGLCRFRQGQSSGRPELRRLLRLRARQDDRRAAPLQGRRFFQDRRHAGLSDTTARDAAPPRLARARRGT
jgi:uncharacterized protein with PIN domain